VLVLPSSADPAHQQEIQNHAFTKQDVGADPIFAAVNEELLGLSVLINLIVVALI
jgi:hypothetical protein